MKKQAKVITLTSSKGGVGKTIFLLNLAGIISKQKKKVLIVDCCFYGGAISINLNLNPKKDVFNISDDMFGNNYKSYKDYLTLYQPNIDIIASCKDPRNALKIDINYILSFIEEAKDNYDIILIDTECGLSKNNIRILDKSDLILYMLTNDLMDIKNSRNYLDILENTSLENIKVILNNSRDINLNYFSNYEIKKAINRNIDYVIDKSLYIKNITSFLIEGEIFTLNRSLTFKEKKDLLKLEKLALDIIEDKEV